MRPLLITSGLLWLAAGCALQPISTMPTAWAVTPQTSACLAEMSESPREVARTLDTNGFSIVNWNIQKGRDAGWAADLEQLHPGADLVLLQEARADSELLETDALGHYRSFAEGFGIRAATGVLTMSTAEPLTECRLVAHEPWFGTRKATLVTEYAIADSYESLLVVNIHSINFTFGISDMHRQLQQAAAIIDQHEGPVVFSGDFNTWHGRRAAALQHIVDALELRPLDYDIDHRKRVFGRPLDHIYVRGLDALNATTADSSSSDHNPMAVSFRRLADSRQVRLAP